MFSALLAYQLIDLALAVAVVRLVARLAAAAPFRRLAERFPALLGTALRRALLLEVPLLLLLFGAARVVVVPALSGGRVWFARFIPAASSVSFLAVGVCFWCFAVVMPVRLVRLTRRAPSCRRERALALALLATAALLLVHVTLIEPARLVVERATVPLPGWPEGRAPLKTVLIADVQSGRLTDHERRLVATVGELAPDLILDAGDLVAQSFDEALALEQARFVLSSLKAPLGVYVVSGDVDDAVSGGVRRIVEGTGARLLDNESVVLACDPPVELAGFDPRDEAGYRRHLPAPPLAAIRVALVHRPRHYAEIGAAGFCAVFAGHTHGGQIVLPGFGPPVTLEVIPRAIAAGGLHRMENGTQLYVTRGVGVEGGFAPRIRFCCPPEISALALGPAPRDGATGADRR